MRESEPVEPAAAADVQPAAMEANTDEQRNVRDNKTDGQTGTRKLVWNPVDERDGEASYQLDGNQVQSMDVVI